MIGCVTMESLTKRNTTEISKSDRDAYFDLLYDMYDADLVLDASGYITAVTCVFIAWSIGSFVYRLIFQNKFEKKVVDAPPTSGLY